MKIILIKNRVLKKGPKTGSKMLGSRHLLEDLAYSHEAQKVFLPGAHEPTEFRGQVCQML